MEKQIRHRSLLVVSIVAIVILSVVLGLVFSNNNSNNNLDKPTIFESSSNDNQISTANGSGGLSDLATWLAGAQGGIFTLTEGGNWDKAGTYNLNANSTIDGNNKIIKLTSSGLSIAGSFEKGMFVNNNNGTIKNINFETANNFTMFAERPSGGASIARGGVHVFGIISAINSGTISNCNLEVKHNILMEGGRYGNTYSHMSMGGYAGNNNGGIIKDNKLVLTGQINSTVPRQTSSSSTTVAGIVGSTWGGSISNIVIEGTGTIKGAGDNNLTGSTYIFVAIVYGSHKKSSDERPSYNNTENPISVDGVVIRNKLKLERSGQENSNEFDIIGNGGNLNNITNFYMDSSVKPDGTKNTNSQESIINLYSASIYKNLRFEGTNIKVEIYCEPNEIPFTINGNDVFGAYRQDYLDDKLAVAGDRTATWTKTNTALTSSSVEKGTVKAVNSAIGGAVQSTYGTTPTLPSKNIFSGITYNASNVKFNWVAKRKSDDTTVTINDRIPAGSGTSGYYLVAQPTDGDVIYLDTANRIVVYAPSNNRREDLNIATKTVNVIVKDGDVYTNSITISGLLDQDKIIVDEYGQIGEGENNISKVGKNTINIANSFYIIADNPNYNFAIKNTDGDSVEGISVNPKSFAMDSGISFVGVAQGIITENDGLWEINERLTSLTIQIKSNRNGAVVSNFMLNGTPIGSTLGDTLSATLTLTQLESLNSILLGGLTLPKHTLTVIGGNGGGEYNYGSVANLIATDQAGKVFAGWYVGSTLVGINKDISVAVKADTIYTASYTDLDYISVTVKGLNSSISDKVFYVEKNSTEQQIKDKLIDELTVGGVQAHTTISWTITDDENGGKIATPVLTSAKTVTVTIDGVAKAYDFGKEIVLTKNSSQSWQVDGKIVSNEDTLKIFATKNMTINKVANTAVSNESTLSLDIDVVGNDVFFIFTAYVPNVNLENATIKAYLSNKSDNTAVSTQIYSKYVSGNIVQFVMRVDNDAFTSNGGFIDKANFKSAVAIFNGELKVAQVIKE